METKTTIPGYLKKEDIAGDVPNLFTGQEVQEQNETEPTPEEMDQYDMVVARVGQDDLDRPFA